MNSSKGKLYLPIENTAIFDGGPKVHLFNARVLSDTRYSGPVVIVEGEYDAVIADQCGFTAIAVPGVTSWQDEWKHLLAGRDVIVAFDGDKAGRESSDLLARRLSKAGVSVREIVLPEGKDMNDLYLDGGKTLVRNTLQTY